MAYTAPYRMHNYMGEFASDAAALTFIQANEWDTSGDGTGNPHDGMWYFNTTDSKPRFHDGSTWQYFGDTSFAGHMRELVLSNSQLDSTDGINAAAAITFAAQPVSGDVISLTDGTTTRTYGADSGGDVQFSIGADVAASMTNFAAAVEGDGSAIWGASFSTDLESIDTDGVVVIIEDANSGTAARVYGTWGTQANCQFVDFTGEFDYSKKATSNLPAADPTTSNFGFRRVAASLLDGEIHYSAINDTLYAWDEDDDVWNQMSGGGSIVDATAASGGGVKGKITVDSDYGLAVASGILTINASATGGLGFSGGALVITPDTNTETTCAVSANGLRVTGLPSSFNINDVATVDVTAAALNALVSASNDVGDTYHDHDSIYYTETELGSTTGGSEGASLIGTDTKTNLNSATDVETALTYLDTQNSARRYTNAGNPNGAVTASAIGDLCIDTSNNVLYVAFAADNATWYVSQQLVKYFIFLVY